MDDVLCLDGPLAGQTVFLAHEQPGELVLVDVVDVGEVCGPPSFLEYRVELGPGAAGRTLRFVREVSSGAVEPELCPA